MRVQPRTWRRLAWVAIALYLAGLGVSAAMRRQGDFAVYYLAGQRAAQGAPLYPDTEKDRFLYAPVVALGFVPFSLLPIKAAQAAFFAVNAAALVALIIGASRIVFDGDQPIAAGLVIVPAALCWRFIDNNAEHGQINIPTLALITWSVIAAERDRSGRAGAMLAAALAMKPFAILGALYLALIGRWRALFWTVIAGLALLAAPAVFFGLHGAIGQTLSYVHAGASMTARYRLMITNQSMVSAAARLMSLTSAGSARIDADSFAISLAVQAILLGLVSIWILRGRRQKRAGAIDRLGLCAMYCLMPSLAPVSWKSYYVALLVPYTALVGMLWIDRSQAQSIGAARALVILSAVLNSVPGKLNRVALFYSMHLVSSIVVLAALFAVWRGDSMRTPQIASPTRSGVAT